MREVTGSTWAIEAIIFFILIFAAFLSLVIQYSRAYIVKNEVLTILEKYEGADSSRDIIGNYVLNQSYKARGYCPVNDGSGSDPDWYGASDYSTYEVAQRGKKYLFCIQKHEISIDRTSSLTRTNETKVKVFYNVIFFYKFNLPILGELHTYRVTGETKSFVGADHKLLD